MDLRHFRYFLALAEKLNFSRAAKRVHIEQSPFSRAIKELERHLGVQLFVRGGRSTQLTYAGSLFLLEAKQILNMVGQAQAKVRNIACGRSGILRIGTADGVAHRQLEQVVFSYHIEETELELQLSHLPMVDLIRNLQCHHLDIGIAVPTLPEHHCGLSMEPLWPDQLVGVISTSHPIAKSKTITFSDMVHLPLIWGKSENWQSAYQLISSKIEECGGILRTARYASGHESMILMAKSGFGLGFALASQFDGISHSNITTINLDIPIPPIVCYALWATDEPPPALVNFIKRAKTFNHSIYEKF